MNTHQNRSYRNRRNPNGSQSIGVNLTWLRPGVVGGTEEYIVRLLGSVGDSLGSDLHLRLYGPPEVAEAHPRIAQRHRFVAMPKISTGRAGRVGLENSWLAHASRRDVLVHHAGGTVPFVRQAPAVVTIHDLQPLEQPQNFSAVKRRWLATALPAAVASSRLVMCPSHYTAARIREILGVSEDRLRVVPHGHQLPPTATPDVMDRVRAIKADRGRFLIYPAIAYAHKRHSDLIEMLPLLGPDLDDVSLVLTGRPGPETPRLVDLAERLGVADRVKILGRVPRHELTLLYRSAEALVFPSSSEGFGNPIVEAMGLECPVVTSDAGALGEVAGEAGLVYPVGELGDLAAAVRQVLTDAATAQRLRSDGRKRAREFDVDIAATRLVAVYREASDTGP